MKTMAKKNFNIVCHNFKNIFDTHSINKFIDVMLDAEQRSTLEMLLHLDSETKIVRTPFAIDELFKNFFLFCFEFRSTTTTATTTVKTKIKFKRLPGNNVEDIQKSFPFIENKLKSFVSEKVIKKFIRIFFPFSFLSRINFYIYAMRLYLSDWQQLVTGKHTHTQPFLFLNYW